MFKPISDAILSVIFYPALVAVLHYWYVPKLRHQDWVPWRATGRFIWEMAWPTVLALAVVVSGLFFAFGSAQEALPHSKILTPILVLGVLVPVFYRARRLIKNPPKK